MIDTLASLRQEQKVTFTTHMGMLLKSQEESNKIPLRGASLNITKTIMKKALKITGKILYFIIALSPIFALGYMLGIKLS